MPVTIVRLVQTLIVILVAFHLYETIKYLRRQAIIGALRSKNMKVAIAEIEALRERSKKVAAGEGIYAGWSEEQRKAELRQIVKQISFIARNM